MLQIPIYSTNSSDFTQTIELDEVLITIRLKFNVRNENWFITVTTENYELKDIKVVSNFPLLRQYKYAIPEISGDFFIQKIDESSDLEVTYDNFGNIFALFYYTDDEVDTWLSANNLS